tara:strand:- start:2563 stop:4164 length:1602 start_codon:yes stop_codon:yes gene_type:complete
MQVLEVTAQRGLNIRRFPERGAVALVAMPYGMRVERLDDQLWNGDWVRVKAQFSADYSVVGYSSRAFLRELAPMPVAPEVITLVSPRADSALKPITPDTIARRYLEELHTDFRDRLETLLEKCKKRKLNFKVFEAYRTPGRQAHLFAQGRTREGAKVTWVNAWASNHNYGLAADIILDYPGVNGWETGKIGGVDYRKKWREMRSLAASCDLKTLTKKNGEDMDLPHVEFPGLETDDLLSGRLPGGGGRAWADNLLRMARAYPSGAPALGSLEATLTTQLNAGAAAGSEMLTSPTTTRGPNLSPTITPELADESVPVRKVVPSRKAIDEIIRHETGGRSYFENTYHGKPVWPGHASGVTIGVGYDLGYVDEDAFRRDWSAEIGSDELDRLARAIGLKSAGPDKQANIGKIKNLVHELSDIRISWDAAIRVFEATSIPTYIARMQRAFPNTDILPEDAFGALLSLVFNRGTSTRADEPTRREMLAIKTHLTNRDFAKIPDEIRSMKRLWPNSRHLQERRDAEADMFESGLRAHNA